MNIDSFVLSVLLQAGDSTPSALKCFKVICIPHTTIRFLMKNWKFNNEMPCLGIFFPAHDGIKGTYKATGPSARSSFQVSAAFFGDKS